MLIGKSTLKSNNSIGEKIEKSTRFLIYSVPVHAEKLFLQNQNIDLE